MLHFKNINFGEIKEQMLDKIKNYNIDYEEEEENDEMFIDNFYKAEIRKNFRLPIDYLYDKYDFSNISII